MNGRKNDGENKKTHRGNIFGLSKNQPPLFIISQNINEKENAKKERKQVCVGKQT
ncbi:MAG: hypothetical protein IPP29_11935 [Bacteroidetes bacterium]|nr:hypothetical protein [Bacteroidota bacterium]